MANKTSRKEWGLAAILAVVLSGAVLAAPGL
jgi:hypothetical protein